MANHPVNPALRFLLELAAWAALGVWGWHAGSGPLRYVLAILAPGVAAAIWGAGRSRSRTRSDPGPVRLAIEIAFFGLASVGLYVAGFRIPAWLLGSLTVLHYIASFDRVGKMLRNQPLDR